MTLNDDPAEIALLAAMLDDPRAAEYATKNVTALDFQGPHRAKLFLLLRSDLHNTGTCDMAMLHGHVQDSPDKRLLERAEQEILKVLPNAGMVEEYCRRLREISQRRAALEKADKIKEMADSGVPDDQFVHELRDAADALEAKLTRSAFVQGSVQGLAQRVDEMKQGKRRDIKTMWPELSKSTRMLMPGTMTILCGSAGATKSLMLMQLLSHLLKNNVTVGALVLEDGPEFHMLRSLAQEAGKSAITNPDFSLNNASEMDAIIAQHHEAVDRLGPCLHELHRDLDATVEAASDWLADQCRKRVRVIAIDPYTLLDFGKDSWVAEKKFMYRAAKLIESSGSSLILVTHPRKQQANGRGAPSMDDLAGSAVLNRKSHTILWWQAHSAKEYDGMNKYREGEQRVYFNRTCTVLKSRNSYGAGDKIAFFFDSKTLRSHEVGKL